MQLYQSQDSARIAFLGAYGNMYDTGGVYDILLKEVSSTQQNKNWRRLHYTFCFEHQSDWQDDIYCAFAEYVVYIGNPVGRGTTNFESGCS